MPAPSASTSTAVRPQSKTLQRYRGHRHLRQRLVLSILSGKSVRIDGIRDDDVEVGLKDYEISFLRLLEKITNGTTIEISFTGTTVLLHPGLLPGGSYTHTCPLSRPIGYYLSPLIPLSIFGKKPMDIKLDGVTGEEGPEMSVDMIRTVTLPLLGLFGVVEGLELMIKKRGAAPGGGGSVIYRSPVVRNVKTLNFVDAGKIRRIRGIAYSTRVSPQFANRMVEAARSILNRYIPDIYLYTDVYKGEESGKSPGYGLTLLSLSTTSTLHSAETLSLPPPRPYSNASSDAPAPKFQTPEDLALHASRLLLQQIAKGGCVDEGHQWLVLLLMVLGREDVGRCRMGGLTEFSIQYLRDLNDFFGVRFKIIPVPLSLSTPDEASEPAAADEDGDILMSIGRKAAEPKVNRLEPEELLISCVGIGYGNINKSMA